MEWWQKIVFPMRRVWVAVAAKAKARKNGGGLLKLHDDVQTCGYEDIQVMWEMLRRSETELSHTHKHKAPICRLFVWSSRGSSVNRA
ncbi:hypothetical protein AAC387_Pa03g0113 [Persea americana]